MFSIVPSKVWHLLFGASVGGWLGLPLDALRIMDGIAIVVALNVRSKCS